jgi:hypothetical protein
MDIHCTEKNQMSTGKDRRLSTTVHQDCVQGYIETRSISSDPQPTFIFFFRHRTGRHGLSGLATPEEIQDSGYQAHHGIYCQYNELNQRYVDILPDIFNFVTPKYNKKI